MDLDAPGPQAALLQGQQVAGRLAIAPRMLGLGSEPVTPEIRDRVQAVVLAYEVGLARPGGG